MLSDCSTTKLHPELSPLPLFFFYCRGLAHCLSALYSFIHTPVDRHLVVSSFQTLMNYYYYLLLCV